MIKPYYEQDGITIYNADCRDVLPQLDKVDLVLTSPPYNMRTRIRNGEYTEREKSNRFSKKYSDFSDALPIEEYYQLHKIVIKELIGLSPLVFVNIQIVTGSKEAWFKLIGEYGEYLKDIIIWDKGEGQPAMHNSVINRATELILALDSSKTCGRAFAKSYFKRGGMSDIWRLGRGGKGLIDGHSAVFNQLIPSRIINGWSNSDDTVLDPFLGSGTTAVACKILGRKCIGIELEEKYCEIAVNRLRQSVMRLEI